MAKGWLDNFGKEDNYNDSQTTAPKGFEGDGYSNVGRNYSPAWGGQFQEGGEIPNAQIGKKVKYVESKNDPRYRAYQDSLSLYNYSDKNKKFVGEYLNKKLGDSPSELLHKLDDNTRSSFKDIAYHEQVEGKFNKIKPIHKTNVYASAQGIKNNLIFTVPSWKKPQQQVIVKPTTTKQTKTKPVVNSVIDPIVKRDQQQTLQPLGRNQIINDEIIHPNLDIPTPIQRQPQYYDITDTNNQNFGGGDTSYRVDNLSDLRELPKEQWERKVTPQFQMGGSVYPVNYVPQAQGGISSPNLYAQEQYFQKEKKENKDYEKLIGNAGEETVDFIQHFIPGLKNLPSLGSTFGVGESLAHDQNPGLSDEIGMIPNPYAQAASLMLLYNEHEGEQLREKQKYHVEHTSPEKLQEEYDEKTGARGNNKKIDNTYVPKPKLDKIAEDSPKNKNTKLPYKEKKEVNKVQIDNTKTVKPRIDSNYKINSTPNSTLNLKPINTFYKNNSFVMPKDINTKVIDNTSVGRSRKGFQSGGSLSGAVGFSYARTQGIPSNGPYAKKTMASAQEGVNLDMYGAPITAIEVNDPSSNRTSYDARTNRMILGSDTNAENRDKAIAHENYHASQYADNRMNYDIAHHTDDEQWARMQKQPAMTSNNEGWSNYYDRKSRETDDLVNNFINNSDFLKNYTNTVKQGSPSVANDIIFDTVYDKTNTDKALYLNPGTSEGEAQRYEDTGIRSFQNGGEMRYYQNGLDWKPKSISRDGGWLNQYDVAQEGEELPSVRSLINDTTNRKNQSKGKEVKTVQKDNAKTITPKLGKQLTPEQIEQRRVQQLIDKQGTIRASTPQSTSSRLKEIALNPLTAFGYAARNENLPENFSRGERNSLDVATDVINPAFYLNQANEAGNNVGSSVSNIAQGNLPAAYRDIKNAGMNTLNALPLVAEYKTIGKGLQQLKNIPTSIAPELRQGLRTNGLTFNGTPRKYPINNYQRTATEDVDRLFKEFPELEKIGNKEEYIKHLENIYPESTQPGIFYRGSKNPNLNASEWISNPGGGNNLGEGFYFTPDPFKAEKYGKEAKALLNIKDPTYTSIKLNMNGFSVPKGVSTKDLVGEGSAAISIENPNIDLFTELGSRDEGYMRKYIGDLDEQGFPVATRPYSSSPDYVDYSKIDELSVPNNSQIHVLGSDDDKKLFKNYLNNNKKRDGGIIKDDRGQWDHPGEITRISGGNITMKKDPLTGKQLTEPLLGIADTGEQQWMYPGEDYNFEGANYVTEYPKGKQPRKAKNGLRQEQKSLQNLDNLVNFTNYNNKQPGGWLDQI